MRLLNVQPTVNVYVKNSYVANFQCTVKIILVTPFCCFCRCRTCEDGRRAREREEAGSDFEKPQPNLDGGVNPTTSKKEAGGKRKEEEEEEEKKTLLISASISIWLVLASWFGG